MKSFFGHSFVEINGKAYSWFNSYDTEINYNNTGYKVPLNDLFIGKIEKFLEKEDKDADTFFVYKFTISSEERNSVISYYNNLALDNANDGYVDTRFDYFNYNCTDVVIGAMKVANLVSKRFNAENVIGKSTPHNLKNKLDIKYRSQIFSSRWYNLYNQSVIKKFNKNIEEQYIIES